MNGKTFIMYLLNQYSKYIRIFTINAKHMYAFSPHFQNWNDTNELAVHIALLRVVPLPTPCLQH